MGSGPAIMAQMNQITSVGNHLTLSGKARLELAFLLKLKNLRPTDLVTMSVMDFVRHLEIKMIGIDTSGSMVIDYSPV